MKLLHKIALALMLLPNLTGRAQSLTVLHSFTKTAVSNGSNSDGAVPEAGLILSSNVLYGTASAGGSSGEGVVFRINADGTAFTNLHNFPSAPGGFNSDGATPLGNLTIMSNTLFGTAEIGGTAAGEGTVFRINTDGSAFTNLHSFAFSEGINPMRGLFLLSNGLYGTLQNAVFRSAMDASSFSRPYVFTATSGSNATNLDGSFPECSLIASSNMFYGTTRAGGVFGRGTVFAVGTNGNNFTNLHNFTALVSSTNSDGAFVESGLLLSGNTLYGVASSGGGFGFGTVFAVNTDGSGFTNLHTFSAGPGSFPIITNNDGAEPYSVLILSRQTLYGTTFSGGGAGNGTVFAVNTDGSKFTNLYSFSATQGKSVTFTNSDGANPQAGVILSGYILFGTTSGGGNSGKGTVFSLSFAPKLNTVIFGTNVILTWPTNLAGFDYTGFTLQSTTNLDTPVTWNVVSPLPVIVNGQETVTNAITAAQMFYRLSL